MLTFFTSPYFLLFARLCVGGVFLASSFGKMIDKEGTAASMSRYTFLPVGSGKFIANVFPFIELIVGLMLVLGLFTPLAAVAALLLFILFTGLIVYDLASGKEQSCHCFGRLSDEKVTPWAVARNVVLMALSLLVAASFDGWLSVDGALAASDNGASFPTVADGIPVVLLAIATVCVVVLGGQAVSMVRNTLRSMGFH